MKALTIPSVTAALVREGVQTIVSWPEQVDGGPVMIVAEERRLETFLAPPNTTLYVSTNAVVAVATLDCVPVVPWAEIKGLRPCLKIYESQSNGTKAWRLLPAPLGLIDVSDQLGFLDLDQPYALALSDVKPVGPITEYPCPGDGNGECEDLTGSVHADCGGSGVVPIPSHSGLWEPPQALVDLIEGETP